MCRHTLNRREWLKLINNEEKPTFPSFRVFWHFEKKVINKSIAHLKWILGWGGGAGDITRLKHRTKKPITMSAKNRETSTTVLCTWMNKICEQSCNKREVQRCVPWSAMRHTKTGQGWGPDLNIEWAGTCYVALMQAWRCMKLALSWQTQSHYRTDSTKQNGCLFNLKLFTLQNEELNV